MTHSSTPFEAFIAPARRYPQIWRILAGCALIAAFWGIAMLASAVVIAGFGSSMDRPSVMTLFILYLFMALTVGAIVAARLLHRRNPATLFGPEGFRPRSCAFAAAALFVVYIVGALAYVTALDLTRNLPTAAWLSLLPFGILGVFIQTSAEEIVFRGYLMQALAARFRAQVIWMGLPSLLFGALHWDAAAHGPNAWLVALSAGLVGLFLADITARCGDLSPAIGLHFANNAMALLVLAPPSPLAGLSLWRLGLDARDFDALRLMHLSDIATITLLYGLWFVIWGRRLRLHSA